MDSDLHPQDDYSHRFFIWHEWIQANGPLNSDAQALDYFATSMYYDKQSNNQVLRMQTMHTGQPILNEAEELKRFTGIEFAIVESQPPSLFVIHKRERLSPEEVRPLAAYFITNNRIYQSPSVYSVISNRLLTSLQALQSSLDILRENRPDFTPRAGFGWPIVESSSVSPSSLASPSKKGAGPVDPASLDLSSVRSPNSNQRKSNDVDANGREPSHAKRQQNALPLFNAMHTTAAHSSQFFASRALADIAPIESAANNTKDSVDLSRAASTPAQTQTGEDVTMPANNSGTGLSATGSGGSLANFGGTMKGSQATGAGPPPESAASNTSRPSTAGGKKRKKREMSMSGGPGLT